MAVELRRKKNTVFLILFPQEQQLYRKGSVHLLKRLEAATVLERLEKHQDKLTLFRETISVKFGDSIQCIQLPPSPDHHINF